MNDNFQHDLELIQKVSNTQVEVSEEVQTWDEDVCRKYLEEQNATAMAKGADLEQLRNLCFNIKYQLDTRKHFNLSDPQ